MENNNVTPIDFISASVDKIKNAFFDENKINLNNIKDELNDTINDFLNNKKEAEFVEETKTNLIDEFDNIFDVDFNNEKKDLEIKNHLLDLLKNGPKEDKEFLVIANNVDDEQKEEIKHNNLPNSDDKLDEIFLEIINHENDEEQLNISEEIKIEDALVSENIEEKKEFVYKPNNKEIKPINIDLIVNNLITIIAKNDFYHIVKKEKPKLENKKVVNIETVDENKVVAELNDIVDIENQDLRIKEKKEIDIPLKEKTNIEYINEDDVVDDLNNVIDIEHQDLKISNKQKFVFNKKDNDIEVINENEVVDNLDKIIDIDSLDLKPHLKEKREFKEEKVDLPFMAVDNRPLEEIFIPNPGSDLFEDENDINQEVIVNDEEKEINDYLDELFKDLDDDNVVEKIEETRQKEIEEKNIFYNSIKNIYPNLDNSFISSVYNLKGSFVHDYKIDETIIILHRLLFNDVEKLRRFVEVIINHDYVVNVDEIKMIVDVIKEDVNKEGLILTEIFAVANQAKLLDGIYDGYKIIVEND